MGSIVDVSIAAFDGSYTQSLVIYSLCAFLCDLGDFHPLTNFHFQPIHLFWKKTHKLNFDFPFRTAFFPALSMAVTGIPILLTFHTRNPEWYSKLPFHHSPIQSIINSNEFYLQGVTQIHPSPSHLCHSLTYPELLTTLSTSLLGSLQSFFYTTVRWYFKVLNLKLFLWGHLVCSVG